MVDEPWLRAAQWVGRRLSRWRLRSLASVLVLAWVCSRLAGTYGTGAVRLGLAGAVGGVLVWPWSRRLVLRGSGTRGCRVIPCRRSAGRAGDGRGPGAVRGPVPGRPSGERVALRVPPGCTAGGSRDRRVAGGVPAGPGRPGEAAETGASRVWLTWSAGPAGVLRPLPDRRPAPGGRACGSRSTSASTRRRAGDRRVGRAEPVVRVEPGGGSRSRST